MKKKIVLWGTNENDQKLLLALELKASDNKVHLHTFPEEIATEDFYTKMMNLWRNGTDIPFPEGHTTIEKDLSITEDLLPENLKVERGDLVSRAKTEWHFAVLSAKMFEMYRGELDDMKTRVEHLTKFDSGMWEELKGFWGKVQDQVREKNLFREQANELRESTNGLFDKLKELRKSLDDEFRKQSKEHLSKFADKLSKIEEKVEKGLGLQPIFNELKNIQKDFRDTKFTKDDRNKLWKRIDKAFKIVKEKRFGDKGSGGDGSAVGRIERRYNGLIDAIKKMEQSINRDKKDKEYQDRKIAQTDSQLELQLKQAKVKMIDERIASKQLKLDDMLKTKTELEARVEKEKEREAKRLEKLKIEEAKKEAKAKIAQSIESTEIDAEAQEKLQAAAKQIADAKAKKSAPTKEEPKVDEPKTEESAASEAKPEESVAEKVVDAVEDAVESVTEVVKDVIEAITDKVEDLAEKIDSEE